MITKLSIYLIELYQKHISSHKGYCCAYRVYHDDLSCSAYTKQSLEDVGLFRTIPKFYDRLKKCKKASDYIRQEYQDMKKEDENFKPSSCEKCGQCGMDGCNVVACVALLK